MTGTAERQRDGSVQYRDAMGRLTSSATAPRRWASAASWAVTRSTRWSARCS